MKLDLEQLCLAEARRHFTQAATIPFLVSPIIEMFMEANLFTLAFDQVLDGTFECPLNTDPFT